MTKDQKHVADSDQQVAERTEWQVNSIHQDKKYTQPKSMKNKDNLWTADILIDANHPIPVDEMFTEISLDESDEYASDGDDMWEQRLQE